MLYNGMSEEELPQYDEKADGGWGGSLLRQRLGGCSRRAPAGRGSGESWGQHRHTLGNDLGGGEPLLRP